MPEVRIPRVCFVVPIPPPYGGIANWSQMVLAELERRGIPSDLIDTSPPSRSVDGRAFYERFVLSTLAIPRMLLSLDRSIREGSQVVHMTTSGQFAIVRDLALLMTARIRGARTIYHIRFGRVPDISRRNTLEWRGLRLAIALAGQTLVIDKASLDALQGTVKAGRFSLIPNPVDLKRLPEPAANTCNRVVYLGWVLESKGVEELLQAWSVFRCAHPDWILQIVGPISTDYRERLTTQYDMQGVSLLGERSHAEAMRILGDSTIFVLPSHTEGFPNVVVEAMALEMAVVATSVGALPEMLADGCGRLVDPHTPSAIVDGLTEFADDATAREMSGKRAGAKAREQYSLDVVMEHYTEHWFGGG